MDAQTRIKNTRALMLVKHPFFASIMCAMPMEVTESVPTAWTNMKMIKINPNFVDTITDKVLLFVEAHEVMHVALEHGVRLQGRDMQLWNIACDYSINMTLHDCGFEIWDQCLFDERFRNDEGFPMSADTIYNILLKEQKEQQQQQGDGQGQGSSGDQDGQAGGSAGGQMPPPPPGAGQGQGQGKPGVGQPGGAHYSPMLGDLEQPDITGDPVAEEALRRDIQQRVAQAANVARMCGNMSGALERFVQQVLEPKVPWQEMLRNFMVQATNPDQETWQRRNRRYPIYLPSRKSETMGPVIFIDDTSGSIGDEEIMQYNGEQADVAETVNPESIRIIYCDSRVKGEQFFERGEFDVSELKPIGGGGTDMRVALDYADQYDPAVVVLLTDGYTPWPKEPPDWPLIVCCTTEAECPVGEVVRI